tara:strand:+ start:311 stop:895 length:585 start_codon:yes stop_codon:yes gene_type:complete
MDENKLRSFIKQIILEQDEDTSADQKPKKPAAPKPKPKKQSKKKAKKPDTSPGEIGVTLGRGRWSKEIAEAGALAEEAPEELMQNLRIAKKSSGFNGVASIVNQAISGIDAMEKAYSGISKVSQGSMSGVQVAMDELDSRNGAKYLHHTLVGAINSGMLSLDVPIQIDRIDTGTVVIYVSPTKNSWAKKEDKKQ